MTANIYRPTPLLRCARFIVGMLAGLCDLARNIPARDHIGSLVYRDGAYLDGFDLTSDLYLLRPVWIWRRIKRRFGL